MTRHLQPVEPPKPRRLNSRREIDDWASERYRTLMALLKTQRVAGEPEQLEFDRRAA